MYLKCFNESKFIVVTKFGAELAYLLFWLGALKPTGTFILDRGSLEWIRSSDTHVHKEQTPGLTQTYVIVLNLKGVHNDLAHLVIQLNQLGSLSMMMFEHACCQFPLNAFFRMIVNRHQEINIRSLLWKWLCRGLFTTLQGGGIRRVQRHLVVEVPVEQCILAIFPISASLPPTFQQ